MNIYYSTSDDDGYLEEYEHYQSFASSAVVPLSSLLQNPGAKVIHSRCREGQFSAVKRLLDQNPELVNSKEFDGRTPLHSAACKGHLHIVCLLVERGADINATDYDGKTALTLAVLAAYKDVVVCLLERGARVDYLTNTRGSEESKDLLTQASISGNEEMVALLLEWGANIEGRDYLGRTALIAASVGGCEEVLSLLLSCGANINAVDKQGNTAIISAYIEHNLTIVELLLQKGADVEVKNKSGNNMLTLACQRHDLDMTKQLLSYGASVEAKNHSGRTVLMLACMAGYVNIVKVLLDNSADVEAADQRGNTALLLAVGCGKTEIISLLLEKGANIHAKNNEGKTVLMPDPQDRSRFETLSESILVFLLKKDAEVNAYDSKGRTPLMTAVEDLNLEVVTLLLEHKANLEARDSNGMTALMHSVFNKGQHRRLSCFLSPYSMSSEKADPILTLLIEKGAKLEAEDNGGCTALMLAAANGMKSSAEVLLEFGADVEAKDNNGTTALMFALRNGHTNVVNFLLEKGADADAKDCYGSAMLIARCKNEPIAKESCCVMGSSDSSECHFEGDHLPESEPDHHTVGVRAVSKPSIVSSQTVLMFYKREDIIRAILNKLISKGLFHAAQTLMDEAKLMETKDDDMDNDSILSQLESFGLHQTSEILKEAFGAKKFQSDTVTEQCTDEIDCSGGLLLKAKAETPKRTEKPANIISSSSKLLALSAFERRKAVAVAFKTPMSFFSQVFPKTTGTHKIMPEDTCLLEIDSTLKRQHKKASKQNIAEALSQRQTCSSSIHRQGSLKKNERIAVMNRYVYSRFYEKFTFHPERGEVVTAAAFLHTPEDVLVGLNTGKILRWASKSNQVKAVFNCQTGGRITSLHAHPQASVNVFMSCEDNPSAYSTLDGNMRGLTSIWNLALSTSVPTLMFPELSGSVFNSTGGVLAGYRFSTTVTVHDVTNGSQVVGVTLPARQSTQPANSLQFNASSDALFANGTLWDLRSNKMIQRFEKIGTWGYCLFHLNSYELLIDGAVWDLRKSKMVEFVTALHPCMAKFSTHCDVIYSHSRCQNLEDRSYHPQDFQSFSVFTPDGYKKIHSQKLSRKISQISIDWRNQYIAVIENAMPAVCKVFEIGSKSQPKEEKTAFKCETGPTQLRTRAEFEAAAENEYGSVYGSFFVPNSDYTNYDSYYEQSF